MLLTLSGSFASAGEDCRRGIEAGLSVAQAHDKIEPVFADSRNEPTTAINEFRRLIQADKALAVYAHRSSIAMPLNPLSSSAAVPLLGAVGHKDFTKQNQFAVQVWPRSDDEGRFLADEFIRRGFKRSALIFTEDEWTSSVSEEFRKRYSELGGTLMFDQAVLPSETDFRTLLIQIAGKAPEGVFINLLLPQIAPIIRQARDQKVSGAFYSNFYLAKSDVLDAVGKEALEGMHYVELNTDLPALKTKLGIDATTSVPGLTVASYVTALLLAQAVSDGEEIRSAADLHAAILRQQEIRSPDYVYSIENRYVKLPLVVKVMREGRGLAE